MPATQPSGVRVTSCGAATRRGGGGGTSKDNDGEGGNETWVEHSAEMWVCE